MDVEHEFRDVMEQMCGRANVPPNGVLPGGVYPHLNNSGFVSNFVSRVPNEPADTPMRCFDPANLPVLNALAREFVICDYWFASHPGPTWPNRFFVHAASPSDEAQVDSPSTWRLLGLKTTTGPFNFRNGTIYYRLAGRGLNHKIYQATNCPQVSGISPNPPGNDTVVFDLVPLDSLQQDLQDPNFDASYIFIEPDYGPQGPICNTVLENDMHPPSDVRDGEALVKQVYESIRNSPVWNQSVFIVVFDEHGGFYDHVADERRQWASSPNDGAVDQTYNYQFNHLGVRVPALIISPWVGRNVIDHTTYDHTSILASVEKLFDLRWLTGRDAEANNFLEVFSQVEPRADTPGQLPLPIPK